MADDSKLPPRGRFKRLRKLAALSAEVGGTVLTRSVQRLAGASGEPLLSAKMAERMVAALGELKGAAMKFGQAASMDPDLFPPEILAVLARLQNQAPPMAFATAREVIERELGGPLKDLFDEVEEAPMAAASLGQVHRARLAGRPVAIKVQYPGVAEALRQDLDNLGVLVSAVSRTSRLLDGRPYYGEMREQLSLELDYRREAELCRQFSAAAAPFADLRVPEVMGERSSEKVLTLELLEGPTLRDFLASGAAAAERFRVGRLLIRATYGPLLHAGQVHADPHPGNFLVLPDGRLGILDFGAVKHLSPTFAAGVRRLYERGVNEVPIDPLEECRRLGCSVDLPDEEARAFLRQMLHIAGRPLRAATYDFATCTMTADFRSLATANLPKLLRIKPPAEAVMVGRALAGCTQNLRQLRACGDFGAVYRELV